ncbi:hypothetical protein E1A91_D01G189700v1 [Gossypium mustelinum]|uniref:Uncharacterized protein n=4 Tax=Gossypium TaxID=3633 RepID=A0A0D2QXF6_GOSRA|nr:hypothetical protein ES319_D01G183600v1 [Gossypium barbadense]KJB11960.1 hypothetical protein B456_002G189800 [Gossypium raimondii]TYG83811.1 hypothetical protein ES288_D01G197800v1 [Gossypium darwinii]TYI98107.1 hypothetical protein E1A91_D01G189700v1 [Gossypium mustelinum]
MHTGQCLRNRRIRMEMTIESSIKVYSNPRVNWRLLNQQVSSLRIYALLQQRIHLSGITQHKDNCPIHAMGTSTKSSERVQLKPPIVVKFLLLQDSLCTHEDLFLDQYRTAGAFSIHPTLALK